MNIVGSLFSRESDSTFTNVRLLVCKTPQQLEIIILRQQRPSIRAGFKGRPRK